MNKSIEELLNKAEWELGFAAWIFAGYSPLKKQKSGLIVRLADEVEIPFGSFEYRGAEECMNQIKNYLSARIGASRGTTLLNLTDRFDRNWMIGLALAPNNNGTFPNNIDVFWAKWACKKHYLPAYVEPSVLTIDEVKERGHFTWRKPSSEQIFAPRQYALAGYGVGTYDQAGKVGREEIKPLFAPSGVHPQQLDEPEPKYALYPWFYEVIEKIISEAMYVQTELEGVGKHGTPLPTAALARKMIIAAGEKRREEDENWFWWLYKADHGGALCWFHDPEHRRQNYRDPEVVEKDFTLTMQNLNSRLLEWFIKTPEGLLYDEAHGRTKSKYFKSKSS